MGNNFLRVHDVVKFSFTNENLIKVKDDYEGAFKPNKEGTPHPTGLGLMASQQNQANTQYGLNVKIAATHAGIITRNNGLYLPNKMKDGVTTWTNSFQKPILVHHEERQDSIGRVIAAQYMDLSGSLKDKFDLKNGISVKDKFNKERGVINEQLIKDFCSGRMPFIMQVDTILSLFRDSLLEDSGYQGLGYIELIANIVDPESIQKLLDGRYLTGSVGATTNKAVCSVCREDWTESGPCVHKPGATYDGVKCFLITGDLEYEEYSFVNVPADRHSKVLELHYNGVKDSIEITNEYNSRIYEANLSFPQYDSVTKEESVMLEKKEGALVAPVAEIKDSVQPVSAPESNESKTEEVKVEDAAPAPIVESKEEVTVISDPIVDATVVADAKPTEEPSVVKVEDACKRKKKMKDGSEVEEDLDMFMTRILNETEVDDEDLDYLYDLMCKDIKDKDAVLSAEKRKKLAKSTFCGPGKSFPIPDCAHVIAGRRLLSRYKGEGSKEKILACINRKAKALGCDKEKDVVNSEDTKDVKVVDTKVEDTQVKENRTHSQLLRIVLAALEEDTFYASEQVLTDDESKMLQSIIKRMATLVTADSFIKASVAEGLVQDPECEKALIDDVVKKENTICDLRDELDALRKEYNNLFKDMEVLQDALTQSTVQSRKAHEGHAKNLMILKNSVCECDLSKLSDTELRQQIDTLSAEVDMKKISDKLNDGISRIPTETVDNPTVIQDKVAKPKDATPVDLTKIQENVYKLLFSGKRAEADAYIRRLQLEGKLPVGSK